MLELGGKNFRSRLLIGTSQYPNPEIMFRAIEASGAEVVTVSIRRLDIKNIAQTFLSHDFLKKYTLLPNTSGCYTSKEAVLTAELAREALETNWIKVEVIADEKTLLPEPIELFRTCEELIKNGFTVFPYTNDDPILCRKLADMGCAAVMPLAAPIGTGLGIRNPHNIQLIRDEIKIPLIVDAGIGTASDAALAMELGCDAILLNSAVALAKDPVMMAQAMKKGIEAGRMAYRAGRIPKSYYAKESSEGEGKIFLK